MSWLIIGGALAVAAVVVRRVLRDGTAGLGRFALRLVGTTAVLGLMSWGLMLLPPVNDIVLGDKPRNLWDFARICEDDRTGDPFPRAAAYEPEAGPHPWVAIENGNSAYASKGTETEDPVWPDDEPAPDTVQLVACREPAGSVPGTEVSCAYSMHGLGVGGQSVEFSQGVYTVTVVEARTGDVVRRGTVRGETGCAESIVAGEKGPHRTDPSWEAYADLLAGIHTAPSGS
jgi:hypothetical protein